MKYFGFLSFGHYSNGGRPAIAPPADTGQYRYEFVPTANDNGTYIVSVIPPEETATTEQGRFTINRLSFDLASYQLTAPRGFAASITVNARASAGTGATGVRWAVVPA